jgi:hypothetical protein
MQFARSAAIVENTFLHVAPHTTLICIMLLSAFIRNSYVPARVEIAIQYEKKLYSVARKFSEFLGHDASLADFTEANVAGYLTFYRKSWSPRATNNQRQVLFSLWQDASDRTELLPLLKELPKPRRIKKLKEEKDPPRCWRKAQMRDLVAYIETLDGEICGIPASLWWLSLVLCIHWTSSRIGAMMAVQTEHYDGRGLLVRKHNNTRPQWYRLPKSCRRILEATSPNGREIMWPSPWCMRTVWDKFRGIVEAAGLPSAKGKRNLFHKLRRGTITYCAKVDPAVAQRVAGHRDYSTTATSYVDETVVRQRSAADILYDPMRPCKERQQPTPDRPIYETQTPRFRIYG